MGKYRNSVAYYMRHYGVDEERAEGVYDAYLDFMEEKRYNEEYPDNIKDTDEYIFRNCKGDL